MSRSEGSKRSGVTTYGQTEVNVSVSPTFSREASLTVLHSLKDTIQEAYDSLSLTNKEKTTVNGRIIEELQHGIYQFVMIRSICSRTRKPITIESARDTLTHFVSIDDRNVSTTIDKTEVDACLMRCRGGNKILTTFTRLAGHLTLLGHGFYYTKYQTTAVYRSATTSFYQKWFPPAPVSEDIVELCLVYNVTKAYAERVLLQFEVRSAAMLTDTSDSPLNRDPSISTKDHPSISTKDHPSISTKDPPIKEQRTSSGNVGHVVPKTVTVMYSPPPHASNAASSENSDDDSVIPGNSSSE